MDNFTGDSSPRRSRELDNVNAPADDHPNAATQKLKFLCSYGGRILPRPHDKRLTYVGGETKIVAIDRSATFAAVSARLSSLADANVSFKYQLPGQDLDALISVTDDEDLLHMLHEHRRLCKSSPNPPRLRLFLFPDANCKGFSYALNSTAPQPQPTSSPADNLDFLFGLDHISPPPTAEEKSPPSEPTVSDPDLVPIVHPQDPPEKKEENLAGDFFIQKQTAPNFTVANQPPFWPEKCVGGGFFPATAGDRPVYMITTPAGVCHAPLSSRPPVSAAYYPMQQTIAAGNVLLQPTAATMYGIVAAPHQQMQAKVMPPMIGELPHLAGRHVFYTTGGGTLAPAAPSP